MKSKKFAIFLGFFTCLTQVLYWGLTFTGVIPIEEIIPGYSGWAWSFPVADAWIALCALLTAVFMMNDNEKAVLYGLLTGSGLTYLGLNATTYTLVSGVIPHLTVINLTIKIAMRIYFFAAGAYFIIYFWKIRNSARTV